MRFLLALLLLALPGQAGRAPLAQPVEQQSRIAAADEHLAQHIRGAKTVGARAEVSRPSSEGAPRSATHAGAASDTTGMLANLSLARGSPLELGFREAARGAHLPYYSLAPPAR